MLLLALAPLLTSSAITNCSGMQWYHVISNGHIDNRSTFKKLNNHGQMTVPCCEIQRRDFLANSSVYVYTIAQQYGDYFRTAAMCR